MWRIIGLSLCGALLAACLSLPAMPPIQPEQRVDLQRFMGDWYVVAYIPTLLDRLAYNAVESYRLAGDGTIATTFTYRKGSFEGRVKRFTPKGFVRDTNSNAVWGMQFMWPVQAEYLISYVNDDYTQTIVARNRRDYVWIMARTPTISRSDYASLVARVRDLGYEVEKLRRMPQQEGPRIDAVTLQLAALQQQQYAYELEDEY